ncbi:acetoacetate--CoA ligase [Heliorestis convoluta]|nr:acetoacetate--CoA ligase [Heliorestis convoluta]
MKAFMDYIREQKGRSFRTYRTLHAWSVQNIRDFWDSFWHFSEPLHSQPYEEVLVEGDHMTDAQWFRGARLNFAENLLRYRDDQIALIAHSEIGPRRTLTYQELYADVHQLAQALESISLQPGDRVAAYMPNVPETVVALLASTALGATWSSTSPDFGSKAVAERFGQIEPKVLFITDGYTYKGKGYSTLEKARQITKAIPSIEKVILFPYLESAEELRKKLPHLLPEAVICQDFVSSIAAVAPIELAKAPLESTKLSANSVTTTCPSASNTNSAGSGIFRQLPANHPLYILYSSGTTGKPKAIVHSAGGTLMQHLKELRLHTDIKRESTLFYYSTCGWMMWNWMVSALALGATVVLYDGSPFHPTAERFLQLVEEEKVTHWGVSAKYIMSIEREALIGKGKYDLQSLQTLLSTGSPLSAESFCYVYSHIKEDLCLSSISGGTDIISCFVLGNPMLPVYAGEIQSKGLAMDVVGLDEAGQEVKKGKGELVCRQPFPSMPLGFWKDEEKNKYKESYFSKYPQVWCHGDYIEVKPRRGIVIHGRSDATLNPGGIRIGTAEIYRILELIDEIDDSLVVGQRYQDDERILLFIKLLAGESLTAELEKRIKQTLRSNATARHVPQKIIPVRDIPYTLNGKKVEIAVRNILHGEPVLNRQALANPDSLEEYHQMTELRKEAAS